jgi:alanyl-tRNA synthetase
VIDVMGGHYTDLVEKAAAIKRTITREEERFRLTMDRGLEELNAELAKLPDGGTLPGEVAFYLKATLGLPIQVTKDVVEERGYHVDLSGFASAEQEHALVSGGGKAMGEIASNELYTQILNDLKAAGELGANGVAYTPYAPLKVDDRVLALVQNGERVDQAITGDKVEIILGATPFYVEAGGQVSDTGVITARLAGEHGWRIEVEDVRRPVGGLVVHVGEVVEGTPKLGDDAHAEVDAERRADITRNHTATHLLQAALRRHLGTTVQQRGSLVAPDRLRFDFTYDSKIPADELRAVESEVNDYVLKNYPVIVAEKTLNEARGEGAMALFGEKYGDRVRTITVKKGDDRYSYELCGGCHVSETAEIGPFVIVSEGSVSAGIRRVEALTGHAAVAYIEDQLDRIGHVAQQLNASPDQIEARVAALQEELAQTRKQAAQLQRQLAKSSFDALLGKLEAVDGKQALIAQVDEVPPDTLREMSDWFRSAVKSGVMVLGTVSDGKPQLLVAVTDDLTKQGLHAGNLIKQIAPVIGGGGGGRPTMAQAGGKDAAKIADALAEARKLLSQ